MLITNIPERRLLIFKPLCKILVKQPINNPANIAHISVIIGENSKVNNFAVSAPPIQKLPSIERSSNFITNEVSHVPQMVDAKKLTRRVANDGQASLWFGFRRVYHGPKLLLPAANGPYIVSIAFAHKTYLPFVKAHGIG